MSDTGAAGGNSVPKKRKNAVMSQQRLGRTLIASQHDVDNAGFKISLKIGCLNEKKKTQHFSCEAMNVNITSTQYL